MNHPDLKATHTVGADDLVRPVVRSVRAQARDGGFSYTFPAHSLTILRLGSTPDTAVFGDTYTLFGIPLRADHPLPGRGLVGESMHRRRTEGKWVVGSVDA